MTADDGHYPGPDVGTTVAVVGTLAIALLIVWTILYLAFNGS